MSYFCQKESPTDNNNYILKQKTHSTIFNLTDSNDYLVLPSSPDIPADIYLLLSSFPGTHKIIEHLHGRVDDVLHCEWDLHLHHQPLVPGQVGLVRCVLPLIYFIINTFIIMRGLNKYFLIPNEMCNC